MPKRSSKDLNQTAFSIVQQSIRQTPKNPAAVALGRLGGIKGGAARAKALAAQRKEIASNAAKKRWSKKQNP